MAHMVYTSIVNAVKEGRIQEPFASQDLMVECPNLAKGTCRTFPRKHRIGNPGGNTELFEVVRPGRFKILRPFRYEL